MKGLQFAGGNRPLSILCFGAHSDDIEIGLGGTILTLIETNADLEVYWCVCSASGKRADEAEASANAFIGNGARQHLEFGNFEDSYFPSQSPQIKQWMVDIRARTTPDVVFTHTRDDAHQDHREVCELTWNVFRDQLILEYEIPKWDGDVGRPNMYSPISREHMDRKIDLLETHFGSQRSKDWFDDELFRGLARIRGMECRAPDRYAEGFYMRKGMLAF
ncbi:PIG-L deacetylase family protein [Mesorhizobium sp. CAU 1732]|uniref:PIG-L deacetylase family protein n=1 Tax=Mesorhizobium sp. CAU 1732 TaxID=3140358 RepID=UPI003260DBE4